MNTCRECGRTAAADQETGYHADDLCPACEAEQNNAPVWCDGCEKLVPYGTFDGDLGLCPACQDRCRLCGGAKEQARNDYCDRCNADLDAATCPF